MSGDHIPPATREKIGARTRALWAVKPLRSSLFIPDGLLPKRREVGATAYYREYCRLRAIYDPAFLGRKRITKPK